jgi:uncharacterized membrane protein
MGTLIVKIIQVILQLLAGVGIGAAMDKVAADKLPQYPAGGVTPIYDQEGNFSIPKIGYFLLAGLIGVLAWRFIARKLKIKL